MAIFSAIGGAIATALSLSATVGSFIGGALAFGARALLGSYLGRKKARPYSAVQGDIQIGGNIPSEAIFGMGGTKGHRLYYAKLAAGDEINYEVLALSNGWCDGLEPYVYLYGKKKNLVELPKIGNEVAHYGIAGYWYDNNPNGVNCFSIRFYDGRPGQGVDQRLVDETANLETPWKATSTVSGHAYVVVRKRFDGDIKDFTESGSIPELKFVLRGLREYDPRLDSTVAGGSGAHRVDDPATWEWTENPAVHRLNYQLGLRGLLSARTIIGEGKTLGQIDLGTYFASMNVCDTLKDGKPTYACSLIVNADDDHTEVLKEFDDAMAGYGLNRRGLSGVIAGAPQLPVLEITKDDIPADRAKELKYRKSAFELYNHMSGQFTSIEDQWNPVSLEPIRVNADVAADGRIRQTSNDFLQVTDTDIAQYLLTIRYRQQRLGGKVTLPVSRRVGLAVSEGQWVEFEGREWLVQGWNLDEDFRFTLTLAETSASVYDPEGIQPGPIIVPSSPPINPDNLPNVQNFAVAVASIGGSDGQEVPALAFTWDPPGDTQITEVRFEYVVGTTPTGATVYRDATADPEAGQYVTSKDVQPGVFYTARQTIRTVPDRLKTWGQWITTAQPTGPVTLYPPGYDDFTEEVQDKFGEIDETLGLSVRDRRDLARQVSGLIAQVMEQAATDYEARDSLRHAISVDVGSARAAFEEQVVVLIQADTAMALRIDSLTATVGANTASIASESQARADADGALAQQIDSVSATLDGKADAIVVNDLTATVEDIDGVVQAQGQALTAVQTEVDDLSAGGYLKITGSAGPSGVQGQAELAVRAGVGGTVGRAAITLQAYTSGSQVRTRAMVIADDLIVTDGGANTKRPFVFSNGVLVMDATRVNLIEAGVIQSLNGLYQLNLTTGIETWDDGT